MAKLKARGRTELFRIEREKEFSPEERATRKFDTVWEKLVRALMSDGNLLERRSAKWPDPHEPGGLRKYDWEWRKVGTLKAGGDPKRLLDTYVAQGWKVVSTSFALNSFDVAAYQAADTVRKAKVEKAKQRRETQRSRDEGPGGKNGPGFYVTNVYTGSMLGKRVAELGPYASLDEAEEPAGRRLRHFLSMSFNYLLPVQIIEAGSRKNAEWGKGHVWWANGKHKGPPVPAEQARLPGVNGGSP